MVIDPRHVEGSVAEAYNPHVASTYVAIRSPVQKGFTPECTCPGYRDSHGFLGIHRPLARDASVNIAREVDVI